MLQDITAGQFGLLIAAGLGVVLGVTAVGCVALAREKAEKAKKYADALEYLAKRAK